MSIPPAYGSRTGTLIVGPDASELKPYRNSHFVLYSVKRDH